MLANQVYASWRAKGADEALHYFRGCVPKRSPIS
jgi:hypothetical protein